MRRRVPIGLTGATGLAAAVMVIVGVTGAQANGCPNEGLRLATHSALLPDCRAYEMVTPPFKEGTPVIQLLLSESGSNLIGSGLGIFAGAERNTGGGIHTENVGLGAFYEFARGEDGWLTRPVAPPPASEFPSAGMQGDASPDLGTTLWKLRKPSQPEGVGDLYRRESDGRFVHLGPLQPAGSPPAFGKEGLYTGASADFKHVLVVKQQGEARFPGDTTLGEESLYEYAGVDEAEPKLVGVSNNGPLASNTEAHLISECATSLGSEGAKEVYNAISADGASVFFTARACGSPEVSELYVRINGSHTVAISEPTLAAGQCTGACATAERRQAFFAGAAQDGSKVFFMTEQPLLNGDKDSTNDLYEAELNNGALTHVVMVSEGETQAPAGENDQTPGEGASVQGVARVSEDGSRVYFVATGVLTRAANTQGDHAEAGADNLYVTDTVSGRTTFVAELSAEDARVWSQEDNGRPVAVTPPDGRFLVLVSRADLTHEGVSPGQVYEYDAQSGVLRRLSLGQHSSSPQLGPSIVQSSYAQVAAVTNSHSNLTMSSDGSYVFFESPDGLTPQASDDREAGCAFGFEGHCFFTTFAQNVYEYHEGHVSLISAGHGAKLLSTDPSGSDVFFSTPAPLVSQDTDTQSDVYDARINGGFPATVGPAGCSSEACRGPLGSAPALPAPGSATPAGGDNLTPAGPPPRPGRATPLTNAQKRAKALKACHTKHNGRKRKACERSARKKYPSTTSKSSRSR